MNVLLVSLVMGIVPMLVYAAFLWWVDHWEREPLPLIGAAFLWGALPSAILAGATHAVLWVVIDSATDLDQSALALVSVTLWAPVTEELIKGLALLLLYVFVRHELDSLLDGIIYGGMVGFGFGAVENVFYFFGYGSQEPEMLGGLIVARAFAFGLMHAFFTSFTGLGFALARFVRYAGLKLLYPCLGVSLAMLTHSLHNTLVVLGGGFTGAALAFVAQWVGIFWVLAVIVISLRRQGAWIKRYLAEEVDRGTLSREQAATAGSFRGRLAFRFAPHRDTRRLNTLSAKLAFKKHRRARLGDEGRKGGSVEQLRRQVTEISRRLTGETTTT